MLALVGLGLLVLGVGVFFWTLRRGNFRRYPHEQFVLVGGALLFGLAAVLEDATPLRVVLFAVELASFVAVLVYFGHGARFPRSKISLATGQRFPDFRLPDSEGNVFDSKTLDGRNAALYLFYRGDW